ncbi:ATP-binding protein [Desulfonema magnum]|uniref:Histidine kinase domain-containing protein n=1 Tax=Desulfonema magnum TaxID=45655 RepID=A0A975GN53_9BACT|nr:ATP-binding protein [Desulfonema magnum]QTA87402.1 Histidine kinase domain-containing protein [Desulfonema magnum]
MSVLKKTFHINKKDFIHAGEASIKIKNLLKSLNTDPKLIRRVAVCGYEGEMNVVMHGGEGFLNIQINTGKILLNISDDGPGIEDIERAMEKGFSTALDKYREMGFGAGMGLPNMKENSDHFTIESEKNRGTRVGMVFFR